jgi:glycosyltransferase involved in cell wall biosynthesis
MKTHPLVSIIVPIYNTEKYLQQCLDSIVNQSYKELDVILINDGSKDQSLLIAQDYAMKDPRIKLIDKDNEGVAATRNVGLKNAQGDFVLYVDSDDWIELDMVELLVSYSIKHDASIVTCDNVSENKCDETYVRQFDEEQTITCFLHHRNLNGSLCTKLIKRSLLYDIYFDSTVGYGEDALFFWQVLIKNHVGILFTNIQLYHYRINQNSICHVFGKQKFTAHLVWTQIANDVEHLYPKLLSMAKAQLCNQMVVILYEAASCRYPYGEDIKMLQKTVRQNFKYLKAQNDCSIKKIVGALCLSLGYRFLHYF